MKEFKKLTLIFKFVKDDIYPNGIWNAHCKELSTATFAHTLYKAQQELLDAVSCHLRALIDVEEKGGKTIFTEEEKE